MGTRLLNHKRTTPHLQNGGDARLVLCPAGANHCQKSHHPSMVSSSSLLPTACPIPEPPLLHINKIPLLEAHIHNKLHRNLTTLQVDSQVSLSLKKFITGYLTLNKEEQAEKMNIAVDD
ncbi:hypothetical protein LAZ67_13001202 [Cordylochernes scorpioides]|uniref:Uncharacterized protein n=1 Tax=Cordylochernes scorpioides TaxID=51811 RepID=A0ABY6L751_9ARAC|nr:hypothetical protein LAZ67_13001202 [Cordylochernes scorpioides]